MNILMVLIIGTIAPLTNKEIAYVYTFFTYMLKEITALTLIASVVGESVIGHCNRIHYSYKFIYEFIRLAKARRWSTASGSLVKFPPFLATV